MISRPSSRDAFSAKPKLRWTFSDLLLGRSWAKPGVGGLLATDFIIGPRGSGWSSEGNSPASVPLTRAIRRSRCRWTFSRLVTLDWAKRWSWEPLPLWNRRWTENLKLRGHRLKQLWPDLRRQIIYTICRPSAPQRFVAVSPDG